MYESHFGFSGSPFQLNPDPAFYFDSRGHRNALAYLKFGAHQGEGFIVVTGEIGAGKTTLVRTLLGGLNAEQVVAAQVVSTQLESGELLQAILMAFGIAAASHSKAQLIGTLEAFLTSLAVKGRRALLIIDEAQNLKHEAVEELRMLSNFQIGNYGLLQSFLVGQPELRQLLQSKSMEQLRQRVIASCHLGPLDAAETRDYVEHRLRLVGWEPGRPGFEPAAFERIHHWTGGVPRRINRLCNRLLLSAYLNNEDGIDAKGVDRTAGELRSEIGELSELPEPVAMPPWSARDGKPETEPRPEPAVHGQPPAGVVPGQVAAREPRRNVHPLSAGAAQAVAATAARSAAEVAKQAVDAAPVVTPPATAPVRVETRRPLVVVSTQKAEVRSEAPEPLPAPPDSGVPAEIVAPAAETAGAITPPAVEIAAGATAGPRASLRREDQRLVADLDRPLICLIDTAAEYLQAGVLAEVFGKTRGLPIVTALNVGDSDTLSFGDTGAGELPMPRVGWHVQGLTGGHAARTGQLLELFERLLDEQQPAGLLALGHSDAVLACALLARHRALPVFRVSGGHRAAQRGAAGVSNDALIDRIAAAVYVNRMDGYYTLYQEGIHSDHVLCVGNLVSEMLKQVLPHAPSAEEALRSAMPHDFNLKDYGLLQIAPSMLALHGAPRESMFALVCALAKEHPLVWAAEPALVEPLEQDGSAARMRAAGVLVVPGDGYLQQLGLLEQARCLVQFGHPGLADEAGALHVPVLRVVPQAGGADYRVRANDAEATVVGRADVPSALKALLAAGAAATDSPAYWDTGVSTRIANHLVSALPRSVATPAPAGR